MLPIVPRQSTIKKTFLRNMSLSCCLHLPISTQNLKNLAIKYLYYGLVYLRRRQYMDSFRNYKLNFQKRYWLFFYQKKKKIDGTASMVWFHQEQVEEISSFQVNLWSTKSLKFEKHWNRTISAARKTCVAIPSIFRRKKTYHFLFQKIKV